MMLYIIITAVVSIIVTALVVCNMKKGSSKKLEEPANKNVGAISVSDPDDVKKIAELEKQLFEAKEALKNNSSSCNPDSQDYEEKIADLEKKLARVNEELIVATQANQSHNSSSEAQKIEAEIQKLEIEISNSNDAAIISKLNKKIKNLKLDLKEMSEDSSKGSEKLKKVEKEKADALEEVEKVQRELKRTNDKFNEAQSKLQDANKQIDINNQSLSFVQSIMSAERSDDTDYTAVLKKIDDITDFINIDIRSFLKEHIIGFEGTEQWNEIFGTDNSDPLAQWGEVASKNWVKDKVKIAFVGEFSAGKTSIVNRILSQDDPKVPRLPVSTKATTAIPTYISKGATNKYSFYSPSNELKSISGDLFNMVSHEILDKVKGISSLIKYFVMRYNNPNLEGLSILDTPGFSHDSEDNDRTIDVINECDALFWVIDVNNGTINRSSLDLIAKKLKKPLFVVINKVDSKSQSEVKSVEDLVAKTFRDKGMTVQKIIRFSQSASLNEMMNTIKSIKPDNSSEEYLKKVKSTLDILLQGCNVAKNESRKNHSEARKKVEEWENYFYSIANTMLDNAGKMIRIPHFEDHFFSADVYEMSPSEYQRFSDLLDKIADTNNNNSNVRQIENSFHGYKEAGETETKLMGDLHEKVSECKEFQKLISKFNKLVSNLDK